MWNRKQKLYYCRFSNFANSINRLYPIFIAGPTAVGKSEIALRLAEQIGGEIISVDSMQVYRGLDIGTAKPSPPNAPACRIT